MPAPNTDLLPPLFEQVLAFFDQQEVGAHVRQDIILALETGIAHAAVAGEREAAQRTTGTRTTSEEGPVVLKTSDRLSGADLSRAALVEQLQLQTDLDATILEVALLLVEAQIDLRLKGAGKFKIADIEFSSGLREAESTDVAWCKSVLEATLKGATEDRPSVWSAFGKRKPAGVRVFIDTIQLSAALRDAHPYVIKVDRHRVESLLAEPRTDERIRLLHISDLHLIDELREEGKRVKKPFGAPSHSFSTARAVSTAVDSLRPRYDLLVATGDLTTDGSRESFETVLQYVQRGSISGENPMRIAAYGLGAARSQRILVPGNHDRYAAKLIVGQQLDDTFEQILETPKPYPYIVGYRPHGKSKKSLTLLFFVFDSTLPEGRTGWSFEDWAAAAAVGRIEEEELRKAGELTEKVVKQKKVDQLAGEPLEFEPSHTIRIALLHHHPVVTQPRTKYIPTTGFKSWFGPAMQKIETWRDAREAALVKMEGADEFLAWCLKSGIQLILFGHQHYPYQRVVVAQGLQSIHTPFGHRTAAIRTFCCPTTLQYDAKGNGFYLFDFLSKCDADSHDSQKTADDPQGKAGEPQANSPKWQIEWTSIGSLRTDGADARPMKQFDRKIVDLDAEPTADEKVDAYEVDLGKKPTPS